MLHSSSCRSSSSETQRSHGALATDVPLDSSQSGPAPADECINTNTGVTVPDPHEGSVQVSEKARNDKACNFEEASRDSTNMPLMHQDLPNTICPSQTSSRPWSLHEESHLLDWLEGHKSLNWSEFEKEYTQEFGVHRPRTAIQAKAFRLKRGWSRKVKRSRRRRIQRKVPELVVPTPSQPHRELSSERHSESAPQSGPAHVRASMGVSPPRQTRSLPSRNATGNDARSNKTPDVVVDSPHAAGNMDHAGSTLPLMAQGTTRMHDTEGRNLRHNNSFSLGSLLC